VYFYTDGAGNNGEFLTQLFLQTASTTGFTFAAMGDGNGASISTSVTGAPVDVEATILAQYSSMTGMSGPRVLVIPDTFTAFAVPVQLFRSVRNVPIMTAQSIGHVTLSIGGEDVIDQDIDYTQDGGQPQQATPIDILVSSIQVSGTVTPSLVITVSTPTGV